MISNIANNKKKVIHTPTGGVWEYLLGATVIDDTPSKTIYGGEKGETLIATIHDQKHFGETDANALLLLHSRTYLDVLKLLSEYLTSPTFNPVVAKGIIDSNIALVDFVYEMEEERYETVSQKIKLAVIGGQDNG